MAFDAATYEIDPLTLTEPRARLEYLRDFLRGLPAERFDMKDWFSRDGYGQNLAKSRKTAKGFVQGCGTAACIAGWTVANFAPRARSRPWLRAANLLGLDYETADALFVPRGFDTAGYTPAEAAAVLDHLLNTGEVDWSVARKAQSNG